MPPSQLKQLKASLRDHGVLGPQKSKKQRKANSKDAAKRSQRNAALHSIREQFNPFEVKGPARREKFEVASNRPSKASVGRPGVTRGLGEERRRETLLKEMHSRHKVGGMLDRRFGEDDPTMTPEEKAAERFAQQSLRNAKKNSMFNLEDDSDREMQLTHAGRSLDFSGDAREDFQEQDLSGEEDFDAQDDRPAKRLRMNAVDDVDGDGEEELPLRKKSKNEVMKEVMAKSKMYKAERQAAKADDDDLRAELDKGMGEFYNALRNQKAPEKTLPTPPSTDSEPTMDPGRAAMLAGKSREAAEKEYEANLRQLKLEARSKPSVRTKTEEETAAEDAARLKDLERKRIRRMRGEEESSDEDNDEDPLLEQNEVEDDAEAFGLSLPETAPQMELGVEDEDVFFFDDDLTANDPDAESVSEEDSDDAENPDLEDDGDDDFINGLVLPKALVTGAQRTEKQTSGGKLAFTFPCPQTHAELLAVVRDTNINDRSTIVQRIRALYHKGLAEENQDKLGNFAAALTEHVAYLADVEDDTPLSIIESLIRHMHSIAKSQPEAMGLAFRTKLREISEQRPLQLTAGDLIILTAIPTVFPTSDQFHTVVTPAMLTLARYLGQSSVQSRNDLAIGAYCCSLSLQYQSLAKRFVPEVIAYLTNAIAILSPSPLVAGVDADRLLHVAIRLPEKSLRVTGPAKEQPRKPSFTDLRARNLTDSGLSASSLLNTFLGLSAAASSLWQAKTAFPEIVLPLVRVIEHCLSKPCKLHLHPSTVSLATSTLHTIIDLQTSSIAARRPLLLHRHRPLAIKSSLPAFVENFNPDRHYDPDRERADLAKLKAEHKRERKGAMRELRKDANFIAREQLREKKQKDEAYEKKFKRLVAEIQGEEGRESKEYEREKAKRTGKR